MSAHDALKELRENHPIFRLTRECEELKARVDELQESVHLANGVADLAMQHRDAAEAKLERVKEYVFHKPWCIFYDNRQDCDCGMKEALKDE